MTRSISASALGVDVSYIVKSPIDSTRGHGILINDRWIIPSRNVQLSSGYSKYRYRRPLVTDLNQNE